ncbi:MAG: ribosome maturation factor RimM [Candidatus Tectimicrobiota bacterium]
MQAEGLIAVGRLTKPHGLQGEVVFLPYVQDIQLLPDLVQRQIVLQKGSAQVETRTLLEWRSVHKRLLLRLQGCDDMTTAEALRDYEVLIPRAWFAPLPSGEYYWFEIEGLVVYASDGRRLGTIIEILHTGSNDVYIVQDGVQETLIPALKNVVQRIDVGRGEMHLAVVAGLLD